MNPLLITACAIAPVAVLAITIWRVPLGYQGADGFRIGTPGPGEGDEDRAGQVGGEGLEPAKFNNFHNLGDTHVG